MRTRSNYGVTGSAVTLSTSSTGGFFGTEDLRLAKINGAWPSIIIPPPKQFTNGTVASPIVGWDDAGGTKIFFAVPSNGLIGNPWQYSDNGTTWDNFNTQTYTVVPDGVTYAGVTYSGYTRSTGWTKGNTSYTQRINHPTLGIVTTTETLAASNLYLLAQYRNITP